MTRVIETKTRSLDRSEQGDLHSPLFYTAGSGNHLVPSVSKKTINKSVRATIPFKIKYDGLGEARLAIEYYVLSSRKSISASKVNINASCLKNIAINILSRLHDRQVDNKLASQIPDHLAVPIKIAGNYQDEIKEYLQNLGHAGSNIGRNNIDKIVVGNVMIRKLHGTFSKPLDKVPSSWQSEQVFQICCLNKDDILEASLAVWAELAARVLQSDWIDENYRLPMLKTRPDTDFEGSRLKPGLSPSLPSDFDPSVEPPVNYTIVHKPIDTDANLPQINLDLRQLDNVEIENWQLNRVLERLKLSSNTNNPQQAHIAETTSRGLQILFAPEAVRRDPIVLIRESFLTASRKLMVAVSKFFSEKEQELKTKYLANQQVSLEVRSNESEAIDHSAQALLIELKQEKDQLIAKQQELDRKLKQAADIKTSLDIAQEEIIDKQIALDEKEQALNERETIIDDKHNEVVILLDELKTRVNKK